MNCPHCQQPINLGHELGKLKSEAKARASRENGRKGGRPKTKPVHTNLKGMSEYTAYMAARLPTD